MDKKHFKIIFVGGGTAGHILPNLAIIEELGKTSKKKNIFLDLLYIGRRVLNERKIIEKERIKYRGVFTGKLRRYWSWRNISDIFLVLIGFSQSFFILLFNRPKIIFAKGGFVTIPFCLAATLLRVPFVIHESDAVLGLSNRMLLPFARKIYLGFPIENYELFLPVKKSLFTGNPIRASIFQAIETKEVFCKKYALDKRKKIILVLGGSQGAEAINRLIYELIPTLAKKYITIHVTGKTPNKYFKKDPESIEEKHKENYRIFGGIDQDEIGNFIANADLIISRAGANSIAESLALKKVSILIPLSSAASNHQNQNAYFLQRNAMASVLDEKILTAEKLYEEIKFLMEDKKMRSSMVKNMKNIFPQNSAQIIAEDILRII